MLRRRWSLLSRREPPPRSRPERSPTTSMPMLLAVPSIIRAAASRSLAGRSAILMVAISRTWSRVTRPTVSRFAVAAPLHAGGLAEEVRGGRRLEDERERAVLEDRDLGRDDLARLVGGLLVVGLRELDDVDAVRS